MSWIELVAQSRPSQVPRGVSPPENAADWYRIENAAADEADVYVYDAIGGWFGTTADDFIREMRDISAPRINLRLNSPGGSVFEGIAIANAIRSHPANVTVFVDGLAASIASVIALAGDRLVMLPQTQLMIHDASGGAYGNAADMEYMVGLLNKQSDNIADAYADRAGGTAAEWRDLMKAETWYTASEAVAAGLADEVFTPPAKEPKEGPSDARMATTWDLSMYRYAGRDKAPDPASGGILGAATAAVVNAIGETSPDLVIPAKTTTTAPGTAVQVQMSGVDTDALILDLLRRAVRAELTDFRATAVEPEAAKPAFLTPDKEEEEDEDEKTEDATDAETEASADDETEDATEDVVDETAESSKPAETPDFWSQVVSKLTKSSPPSADDVLRHLKEAS